MTALVILTSDPLGRGPAHCYPTAGTDPRRPAPEFSTTQPSGRDAAPTHRAQPPRPFAAPPMPVCPAEIHPSYPLREGCSSIGYSTGLSRRRLRVRAPSSSLAKPPTPSGVSAFPTGGPGTARDVPGRSRRITSPTAMTGRRAMTGLAGEDLADRATSPCPERCSGRGRGAGGIRPSGSRRGDELAGGVAEIEQERGDRVGDGRGLGSEDPVSPDVHTLHLEDLREIRRVADVDFQDELGFRSAVLGSRLWFLFHLGLVLGDVAGVGLVGDHVVGSPSMGLFHEPSGRLVQPRHRRNRQLQGPPEP